MEKTENAIQEFFKKSDDAPKKRIMNGDRVVMYKKFFGTVVGVGKNSVWVQFDNEPKEWREISINILEVVE